MADLRESYEERGTGPECSGCGSKPAVTVKFSGSPAGCVLSIYVPPGWRVRIRPNSTNPKDLPCPALVCPACAQRTPQP